MSESKRSETKYDDANKELEVLLRKVEEVKQKKKEAEQAKELKEREEKQQKGAKRDVCRHCTNDKVCSACRSRKADKHKM